MTVQADDRRKEYPGNGVAVAFDGPRALVASTVKVYLEDADGVSTEQTSGVTLSGVGRANTVATFDTAPPVGSTVIILRTLPYSQECDISNQSAYLPEVLEEAGLDTLEMQIQQLADRVDRGLFGSDTNSEGAWNFDADNHRIINLADGVLTNDAVNLGQVLAITESAVNGGPTYGVTPQYWEINGDGVATDFAIAGADVSDPAFYDVYYNRVPQEPFDDFTIVLDDVDLDTYANSAIRFASPLANGQTGWVVLRGYARAVSLGDPVTGTQVESYLRVRPVSEVGTAFTLNRTTHGLTVDGAADVRCTNAAAVTATLRKNTGDTSLDWKTGDFFTITQSGAGAVSLSLPSGVTVDVPTGYSVAPRARYCSITLRCVDADTNAWAVSGDLLVSGTSVGTTLDGALVAEPATTVASASGVLTLDLSLGNFFRTTLTENITSIVLTNEPLTGYAKVISLEIVQHATVAKTVAWPAGWKWPGGSAGAVSTGASAVDELSLAIRNPAGTKLYRASLTKGFA